MLRAQGTQPERQCRLCTQTTSAARVMPDKSDGRINRDKSSDGVLSGGRFHVSGVSNSRRVAGMTNPLSPERNAMTHQGVYPHRTGALPAPDRCRFGARLSISNDRVRRGGRRGAAGATARRNRHRSDTVPRSDAAGDAVNAYRERARRR